MSQPAPIYGYVLQRAALALFRNGADTKQIAAKLALSEAEACDVLHAARANDRFGKKDPRDKGG